MANLKNFPDSIDWSSVQGPWEPPFKETDLITASFAENSPELKPQVEFITRMISEWDSSAYLASMAVGQNYYDNKADILKDQRTVIGRNRENGEPILTVSTVLANNRISHPFLKKLTRQKLGYLIGEPFILSEVKKNDAQVRAFIARCKDYMGKSFYKMIKNVARDSIVKKIGWIMVYYNEEGKLKFRRCEPENVIPLWADADHNILDAAIYRYTLDIYSGGEKEQEKHVDYYTKQGVYKYIWRDAGGIAQLERLGSRADPPMPYFAIRRARAGDKDLGWDEIPMTWDKIPFIPFKYDPDEQSLLDRIKTIVDDYNKRRSQLSNNIEDFPNAVTVVRNYDGEDKEEFVHNKNVYRCLFVTGDGDAKTLDTPLNITDTEKYLEQVKNNVYEFGSGVNTANKDIRDTSGVALKYLYADLDTDCIDWGTELEWSLMELFWFVQQDIYARYGENYTEVEYSINFKRSAIINISETIQNAFQSVGVISQRTIIENHPWVMDVDKEMEDLHNELQDTLELKDGYAEEPTNPALTRAESLGQG